MDTTSGRLLRSVFLVPLVMAFELGRPHAPVGVIGGTVTVGDRGAPVPFANVEILSLGMARFADADGRFVFDSLPPGPVRLRVRQLGYAPSFVTVVVDADAATIVLVHIARMAAKPAAVKARSNPYCGSPDRWNADSAVATILDQVIENAERNRLLVRNYPYKYRVERVVNQKVGDKVFLGFTQDSSTTTDTTMRSTLRQWRYAPGALGGPLPDMDIVNLLELADLADTAFLDNHCWRYRGVETIDGDRLLQIDFEPVRTLKVPDISGSVFLDTATYDARRMAIKLTRTFKGVTALEERISVATVFREYWPGVPTFDRLIASITLLKWPPCREVPGPPDATLNPKKPAPGLPITVCPTATQTRVTARHQYIRG